MGSQDLSKMNRGQMDPDGKGLTMAGVIIGTISLILGAIGGILRATGKFPT
jgi:hypothetical protein